MSSSASSEQPPVPLGKRARTRARILASAGTLFANHGVTRTAVDDIAVQAEVSVGSIYQHFGSKPALAMAWIEEALDTLEQSMAQARTAPRAIDRIYAAGDAYYAFAIARPAACRFLLQNALQPALDDEEVTLRAAASARIQRIVLGIASDAKCAADDGDAYPAPTDEAMVVLWGLWSGIASLVLRTDGAAIPDELGRRAIEHAREVLRRATAHALQHPGPFERD